MIVTFVNTMAADSSFSVQWDGGQSGRTSVLMSGQNSSIDMANVAAPEGTSCWAEAYVQGGPNHASSDNFTQGGNNVTYILSGSIDTPSFSMN